MKKEKPFNLASLTPETGFAISPRAEGLVEMFDKLDALQVGQSYRMPRTVLKTYASAKSAHKRNTSKVFIYRILDKYYFRCWRVANDTILRTSRKAKK